MKIDKYMMIMLLFVLALLVFVPTTLRADLGDKLTVLTFNQPFQVPGVTLQAGSYVFKLVDPQSSDHMVRVLSQNQKQVYATFFAVPDYRVNPDNKTMVTFMEREKGTPLAIKEWFHPGDVIGEEFIYPKVKPVAIASNTAPMPVPTPAVATAPAPAASTPAPAQQMAAVQPPTSPAMQTTRQAPKPAVKAAKLPKTASPIPSLALLGLVLLGTSIGIGKRSRQLASISGRRIDASSGRR